MGVLTYFSWPCVHAQPGGSSWTPRRYAARMWHVPPAAKQGEGHIRLHARKDKRRLCTACHRVYRHDRHRVVPPADLGRAGQPCGHASGARLCAASDRRRLWVRCADSGGVGGARWPTGPGGPGTSGGAPTRPGPGASRCHPRQDAGGIVWLALAMLVKTRLWLAGEGSAPRDRPLIRRLLERVRRGAAPAPLLRCTDGVSAYVRARRETCRDPVPRRPRAPSAAPLAPSRHRAGREARRAAARGRHRAPYRGWHAHACRDAQASLARARGDHTADIERLQATFRERLASLTRRGSALRVVR